VHPYITIFELVRHFGHSMKPCKFRDNISNGYGSRVIALAKQTDRKKTQTDTSENNTTLVVRLVNSFSVISVLSMLTSSTVNTYKVPSLSRCSKCSKQLGGRAPKAVESKHACYTSMWRPERTYLDPTLAGSVAPLLQNFRFLISKRRTSVNC